MQFFSNTHYDFLGRKWWFILPSLVLLVAGAVSLLIKHGPRYSIEFRGGAVMDVQWPGTPPIERIRAAVSERLSGVSVLAAHDLSGSNEVLISVELQPGTDLNRIRRTIREALSTLNTTFSIRSFEVIGPEIGADLRRQALLATGRCIGRNAPIPRLAIPPALWVAAVIAMAHDAFIRSACSPSSIRRSR